MAMLHRPPNFWDRYCLAASHSKPASISLHSGPAGGSLTGAFQRRSSQRPNMYNSSFMPTLTLANEDGIDACHVRIPQHDEVR